MLVSISEVNSTSDFVTKQVKISYRTAPYRKIDDSRPHITKVARSARTPDITFFLFTSTVHVPNQADQRRHG